MKKENVIRDDDTRGLRFRIPSSELPPPSNRLSPEQITDLIHRLAKEGEGADQRWALKMLAPQDNSIQLAAPMSDMEVIRRLARLMNGVGAKLSQRAFALAHPQAVPLNWRVPEPEMTGKFIVPTTLRALYENFPEAEREVKTGAPPGYPPLQSGSLKRRRFIYDYAVKLLHARKEAGASSTDGGGVTDDRPARETS